MPRVLGAVTTLACFCAVAGTAPAHVSIGTIKPILVAVSETDEPGCAINTLDEPCPLPPDVEIQRHYYSPSTGESGLVAGREEHEPFLVYSNTGGAIIYTPGPNRRIADDLTTIAIGGCHVSGYEILVGVSGSEGGGDSYTVEFGLWTACPGASPPGQLVIGTEGTMDFEDDGDLHLIVVDLEGSEVPMGRDFWVGVRFTGNTKAGWVAGSPAEMGYTQDLFDVPHPALRCSARIGGGWYSGFYIKIYCNDDPPPPMEFPSYINPEVLAPMYPPGAGQWIADDAFLIVDECELSSFNVGIVGFGGPFTMDVELWGPGCGPEDLIEGTQRTYEGGGDGYPEVARFVFVDEEGHGIDIGRSLWIAWRFDNSSTGPILSGEPVLGYSEDLYALLDPWETCDYHWFSGDPYAGFNASIYCLAITGACCDQADSGEWLCRDTMKHECVGPLARWARGASCSDPDAFDPPCGAWACCWWWGICNDVLESNCGELGGMWYLGYFCGDHDFRCPDYTRCLLAGWDIPCCEVVCDADPYCRDFEWDSVCESLAYELCCIADAAMWLDPPDGVVDARQPHALDDWTDLQGIDTIRVQAATGDDRNCWDLCETDNGGREPNAIKTITDTGDDTFTITLERPITPGAVTMVYYADGRSIGSFISHPGNVDGDGEAGPADILALVYFLSGTGSLPWGLYSCDLDGNAECGPADIFRLVDLLNGAGEFDPWNETLLPVNPGTCP